MGRSDAGEAQSSEESGFLNILLTALDCNLPDESAVSGAGESGVALDTPALPTAEGTIAQNPSPKAETMFGVPASAGGLQVPPLNAETALIAAVPASPVVVQMEACCTTEQPVENAENESEAGSMDVSPAGSAAPNGSTPLPSGAGHRQARPQTPGYVVNLVATSLVPAAAAQPTPNADGHGVQPQTPGYVANIVATSLVPAAAAQPTPNADGQGEQPQTPGYVANIVATSLVPAVTPQHIPNADGHGVQPQTPGYVADLVATSLVPATTAQPTPNADGHNVQPPTPHFVESLVTIPEAPAASTQPTPSADSRNAQVQTQAFVSSPTSGSAAEPLSVEEGNSVPALDKIVQTQDDSALAAVQAARYLDEAIPVAHRLAAAGPPEKPPVQGQKAEANISVAFGKSTTMTEAVSSGEPVQPGTSPADGQSTRAAVTPQEGTPPSHVQETMSLPGEVEMTGRLTPVANHQNQQAAKGEHAQKVALAQPAQQANADNLKMAKETPSQAEIAGVKTHQDSGKAPYLVPSSLEENSEPAVWINEALPAGGGKAVSWGSTGGTPAEGSAPWPTADDIPTVEKATGVPSGSQTGQANSAAPTVAQGYASAVDKAGAASSTADAPAAGASQQPLPDKPSVPAGPTMNQIVSGVRLLLKRDRSELQLRLRPPMLGTVRLSLITDEDGLSIRIDPQTSLARSLIEQNLPELRHSLESHGLQIGKFWLGSDQPGWGSDQGSGNSSARFDEQRSAYNRARMSPAKDAGRFGVQEVSEEQRMAVFYGSHNLNILI